MIKITEVINNTMYNNSTVLCKDCREAGEENTDSKNYEDSKILPLIENGHILARGIEGGLGTSGNRGKRKYIWF